MSQQYVYSMLRVSKVVPPQKTIIKDISLSFFPGAKIGLLGLNGADIKIVNIVPSNKGFVQRKQGVVVDAIFADFYPVWR